MSFASKYNKGQKIFTFEKAEDEEITYFSPSELEDKKVYTVKGFYKNTKGRYDDTYVIYSDSYANNNGKYVMFINAPAHMNKTFEEILTRAEDVELINNGYVGVERYSYVKTEKTKNGKEIKKTYYGLNFVDIDLPF